MQTPPTPTLLVNAILPSENPGPFSVKYWLLTRIGGFGSNQLMWLRIKTDIDPSGRMCRLPPARYIKEDDVMPLALSQSNPAVGSSPSFCSGRKLGDLEQALLWSLLQEDPQCPSRLLLDEAA